MIQQFKHPPPLEEIYQDLNKALRLDPQNPDRSAGMAYFLILIGALDQVPKHLAKALRLNPEHSIARQLVQGLNELKQQDPLEKRLLEVEAFQRWPRPQTASEYDDLYDETERFIRQEALFYLQAMIPPEVNVGELEQNQRSFLGLLHASVQSIQAKLEILESEFEVDALERELRPLSQLKTRFEKVVNHNLELIYWQEQLQSFQEMVHGAFEELKHWPKGQSLDKKFSDRLEALYDICDQLADELDSLAQRTSIAPIENQYEAAVQTLQKLQDSLDEF